MQELVALLQRLERGSFDVAGGSVGLLIEVRIHLFTSLGELSDDRCCDVRCSCQEVLFRRTPDNLLLALDACESSMVSEDLESRGDNLLCTIRDSRIEHRQLLDAELVGFGASFGFERCDSLLVRSLGAPFGFSHVPDAAAHDPR